MSNISYVVEKTKREQSGIDELNIEKSSIPKKEELKRITKYQEKLKKRGNENA